MATRLRMLSIGLKNLLNKDIMNIKLLKKARKKITIRGRRNCFEVKEKSKDDRMFYDRHRAIAYYCNLIIGFAYDNYHPKQNIHK